MFQLIANFIQCLLNFKENPKATAHAGLLLIILLLNYILSHFTNFQVTIEQITGFAWLYEAVIGLLVTWIGMAIAFFSRNVKKD